MPISYLKEKLSYSLVAPEHTSWHLPNLTDVLNELRSCFGTATRAPEERSIAESVIKFSNTRRFDTFRDLKYTCFGITLVLPQIHGCLLDSDYLFAPLLTEIKSRKQRIGEFRKCYQGLMSGYFKYPIMGDNLSETGQNNWNLLQLLLREKLEYIVQHNPHLTWVLTLKEHKNLLGANPCERYAPALMQGDMTELNHVCSILVPNESWVLEQAILSQIRHYCTLGHIEFKNDLNRMIQLSTGQGRRALSDKLKRQCLAALVIRYSQCDTREEHSLLRDELLKNIGNPWLKRAAWDAHVNNEPARKMVDSWLKRRLIIDFFQVLAQDGAADVRRLNYWIRFADIISDIWFALGSAAQFNQAAAYREIRVRIAERKMNLEHGGVRANNAFIICIADMYLVEFGVKGNAFFAFMASNLPFSLSHGGNIYGDSTQLKSDRNIYRQTHVDRPAQNESWEEALDAWLLPKLQGWQPDTQPYSLRTNRNQHNTNTQPPRNPATPQNPVRPNFFSIDDFVAHYRLVKTDHRSQGGALWISGGEGNRQVSEQLRAWGFRFHDGRRMWWRS